MMAKRLSGISFDELVEQANKGKTRRKRPTDKEHQIQVACVRWFSYMYPQYKGLLFAVPNGGVRDARTASKLKAEGVVAGVSDLIFLKRNKHYGALLIEMKKEDGIQSRTQKKWEELVTKDNEYKYVICRSVDDFEKTIKDYLKEL